MFLANIEAADRIEESADDMTAADRAPRPRKVMIGGQRYCRVMGRIIGMSSLGIGTGPGHEVRFQSEIIVPLLCMSIIALQVC